MRLTANQINNQALLLKAMENNMREKLCYIPRHHPDMQFMEINNTLVVDSGLPSDTFNTAFGGIIDLDTAKRVFNFYTNQNYPCSWWIGPSSESPDATLSLEEAGFVHAEYDVGMIADLTQLKDLAHHPEGLSIKKCETEQDLNDFGRVLSSVFAPSPEALQVKKYYENFIKVPASKRPDLQLFVGYEHGEAVSTSVLFLTDCAGIFDISTRPEHRCKGLGTALFHHALKEACAQGYEIAVLQASPDGLGIYQKYGFQKLGDFNVWSNVHALDESRLGD